MNAEEAPARPRRADAVRNSERLVQAAREVFAQRGLSATLHDISEHAGVGIGTVYRNFASKHQIVEMLYDAVIDTAVEEVRDALTDDDPWQALVSFFEVTAANQARDRGLIQLFLGQCDVTPDVDTAGRILDAVAPLFDRAHAAGVLRKGASATDILPIFAMLDAVYRLNEESPELWRRYLAMLLDGLRATERPPLPVPPLDTAAFGASLGRSH